VSVRDLIASATSAIGGVDARLEAELLLSHVLGQSRAWLFAWPEHEPDHAARDAFARLVDARRRGEPIAYLVGMREFWSLPLEVTRDVLIPRPETELLVELALSRVSIDASARVADLGTGSGAIALAIAKERPRATIVATDASEAALEVARRNAQRLGFDRVEFVRGDWFEPLAGRRFDVVATNPPYIADGDAHLAEGDLRFEPASALASGVNGIDAIRRIVAAAPPHLADGGWLVIEHGWTQGADARALLAAQGFIDIATEQDAEGRDRVTLGRRA
jgi:release factor glutamine methyltransferase